MWIVIERLKTKSDHCWFSGVFLRYEDMQDYLSLLPERPTETREIRVIPVHEYPVLFVYDSDIKDLSHITLEQLSNKLFNLKKVDDDDHEYCKYYIFKEDYRGFSPGEEYYAWDNHHHVINLTMQALITRGLRIACVGGINGIYSCENCNRQEAGMLLERGYEPPSSWQIFPVGNNNSTKYLVACSEKCRLALGESL